MAKQSAKERAHRLSMGCCPIHGQAMSQVGNCMIKGEHYFVVECDRKDCDIRGTTTGSEQQVILLPVHQHLVGPALVK